jgi:hypothetical protein
MINSEIPTSSTLASLNFPSDVLCIAFQFIPLGELYRNAVFVCQEWRSVADSEAFWKCGLSSAVINALNNGQGALTMKGLYISAMLKNRIRNPRFTEGYSDPGWKVMATPGDRYTIPQWEVSGHSVVVENPPIGVCATSAQAALPCVATSYGWGKLHQDINLSDAPASVLCQCAQPIALRFHCSGRSDQLGHFNVNIGLLNADGLSVYRWTSERHKLSNAVFQEFVHVIQHYPKDAYTMQLVLEGKDSSFWSGYYGAKFSDISLRFVKHSEVASLKEHNGWLGGKVTMGPGAGVL